MPILEGLAIEQLVSLGMTIASQAIRAAELAQAGDKSAAIAKLDEIRDRYDDARAEWDATPGPTS